MTRYESWKSFAALCAVPLMFFAAAVFDPGAMGEIARAATRFFVLAFA